jgi:putative transposase
MVNPKTKPKRLYRTDLLPAFPNQAKQQKVLALVRAWRRESAQVARRQWRLFFTTGRFNAFEPVRGSPLGTSYGQMVQHQVVGSLASWVANRQNDFRRLVMRSALPEGLRHELNFINSWKAWYTQDPLTLRSGQPLSAEARRLARVLFGQLLKRHRRPTFRRVSPFIDQRCVKVTRPTTARAYSHWVRLSTLEKGQPVSLPLQDYGYARQRQGQLALSVQLVQRESGLYVGLMTDVTDALAAQRAAYQPRTEALGLDLGLSTLLATSQGDLLGRDWLAQLRQYDTRLTRLAAHRQRSGLKVRSPRYRRYVQQLRGWVTSEVGRVFNRLVAVHAPAELVVERLDFRNPGLSRRLNRLLALLGKGAVARKLQDLTETLGIVVTEVNAAYTSQTDAACGYVDSRNRTTQSRFKCGWCGTLRHADVNAACNVLQRRSLTSVTCRTTPQATLAELTRQFSARYPRARAGPPDPRLSNPYFRAWATLSEKPGDEHPTRFCT